MKEKTIWRWTPCPDYDIEGLESWLADLAAQGYGFVGFRLRGRAAAFRRQPPQAVRYRFSASYAPGRWDDAPNASGAEAALYAEMGWRCAADLGAFQLWACDTPDAPELHTDPRVQALTFKKALSSAFWRFIATLWFCLLYPLLNFRGRYIRMLVELPAMTLFYLGICLVILATALLRYLHLRRLRRQLRAGRPLSQGKEWQKGRRRHVGGMLCSAALALGFLLSVLLTAVSQPKKLPLPPGTALPFATLADLADGELVLSDGPIYIDNHLLVGSSLLAPQIIDFEQHGKVVADGQTLLSGNLYVDYFELRLPALALPLAKELPRSDLLYGELRTDIPLPDGLDYAAVYGVDSGIEHIILVKDGRVLALEYFTFSDRDVPLREIAWPIATYFLQQG